MPDNSKHLQEEEPCAGPATTNNLGRNHSAPEGLRPALPLRSRHLADLRRSELSNDTILKARIHSVSEPQVWKLLHRRNIRGGGYAIPYFNLDGTPLLQKDGQPYVNIKVEVPPRSSKGKPQKYLKPTGVPNALYVPPGAIQRIKDSAVPLLFTEGEKKALKAVQEGFLCIAFPGVWGFKTRKGKTADRSIPLPQLDEIPMCEREMFIAFDSDLATNPKVQQAERAFAEYACNRGAIVYSLRLPEGLNGAKVGLDDFLIQQGGTALNDLMGKTRRAQEGTPTETRGGQTPRTPLPADVADDFLIAQDLRSSQGLHLRFYREEWLLYDGRTFQPLPLPDLKVRLVEHLRSGLARAKTTQYFVNNVLLHLQSLCAILSAVILPARLTDSGWVSSSDCLVLTNGILDLHALLSGHAGIVLTPLNPSFVGTVGLPFGFDPKAQCPQWLHFLEEILPDPESRLLLKEVFGYCITYDTSLQKFFLFEGTGANGKGVVLRILIRLLGEANVSSLPLELFGTSHDLIATLGKLVNITSEIGDLDRVAEGLLKQFTGDDVMHFNPKHRTPFSAKPTAKLIIAANARPPFRDRSEGVWRRLIILPFPVFIEPKRRNPDLTENLTVELSGILNWAIAGAFSLRKRRHFIEPSAGILARQQFQRESNPARLFLEECCEGDSLSVVPTVMVYQAYVEFCKSRGYRQLNETHFGREVRATFAQVERVRLGVHEDGSRPWGYQGIKMIGHPLSYQSY